MLATALESLARTGLTVSLDHISLEDLIREAGVSRSAVYRRWPYKDLFIADLVKELARNAVPAIVDDEIAAIRHVLGEHQDELDTPRLRGGLVAELIRQLALVDFEILRRSARWQTYLALSATFTSIADDDTRQEVGAALAESERAHIASVARAWQLLTGLLGYRLRPDSGTTFETLATLLTATIRGLVTMALSDPAIATSKARARPPGATETADWSLPGLALASIASGLLEPDPSITWDAERIARVRQALDDLTAADIHNQGQA
jgi:AcrR family transcriptional regulator